MCVTYAHIRTYLYGCGFIVKVLVFLNVLGDGGEVDKGRTDEIVRTEQVHEIIKVTAGGCTFQMMHTTMLQMKHTTYSK